MQSQLVSAHGMLAILEVLEVKTSSRDVMAKLLQIVNLVSKAILFNLYASKILRLQLVNTDTGFLESFCLIG